jgi:hypothetical protein
MGLRQPAVNQESQGLLPFDFDATDATDEVTGRAGLPLLLETMMALHVGQAVKQHQAPQTQLIGRARLRATYATTRTSSLPAGR